MHAIEAVPLSTFNMEGGGYCSVAQRALPSGGVFRSAMAGRCWAVLPLLPLLYAFLNGGLQLASASPPSLPRRALRALAAGALGARAQPGSAATWLPRPASGAISGGVLPLTIGGTATSTAHYDTLHLLFVIPCARVEESRARTWYLLGL